MIRQWQCLYCLLVTCCSTCDVLLVGVGVIHCLWCKGKESVLYIRWLDACDLQCTADGHLRSHKQECGDCASVSVTCRTAVKTAFALAAAVSRAALAVGRVTPMDIETYGA